MNVAPLSATAVPAIETFLLQVNFELLLIQLLNGLALGVLYVLMVSGLSVIFGITDIINFAHGAFYMLGAYLAFTIIGATGSFFIALLIAPIALAVIIVVVERLTLNRIYDRGPLYHILLTFGLVLVITDTVELIWGRQPKPVGTPDVLAGRMDLGPILYPKYQLFIIVAGSIIMVGTWAIFRYTRFGLIVRAGAQDPGTVRLMGVDLSKYFTLVFGLGALLAGAAGALASPFLDVSPTMGNEILITAFIIVIVGGLGSYLGSVLAAFAIALAQTLTIVFVPALTGYTIYLIMFAILLVRPQGILGTHEIRKELAKISYRETIEPIRLTDRRMLVVLALLAVVPLGLDRVFSSYVLGLITLMLIWGLFALSLDVVMGYLGLISFGHAAFYGVGAYAVALAVAHVSDSFLLALLVAMVATGVLAWVIGALSVRFSGVYFAIITFAAAQLLYQFSVFSPEITGGSDGMSLSAPQLLQIVDLREPVPFYYLTLVVLVASYFVAVRVMDSPFGRVLAATRESERRVSFLGYNTNVYKRRAFALSGVIGGLAGALFATYQRFVTPDTLYWLTSGDVLFALIFGGIGTLYGPIAGGATLVGLEQVLSTYTEQWRLVVGLTLVLVVMFAPRGLVSVFRGLRRSTGGRPVKVIRSRIGEYRGTDQPSSSEDRQ